MHVVTTINLMGSSTHLRNYFNIWFPAISARDWIGFTLVFKVTSNHHVFIKYSYNKNTQYKSYITINPRRSWTESSEIWASTLLRYWEWTVRNMMHQVYIHNTAHKKDNNDIVWLKWIISENTDWINVCEQWVIQRESWIQDY